MLGNSFSNNIYFSLMHHQQLSKKKPKRIFSLNQYCCFYSWIKIPVSIWHILKNRIVFFLSFHNHTFEDAFSSEQEWIKYSVITHMSTYYNKMTIKKKNDGPWEKRNKWGEIYYFLRFGHKSNSKTVAPITESRYLVQLRKEIMKCRLQKKTRKFQV